MLEVIQETTVKKGRWNNAAYICKCDYGNLKVLRRDYLLSGRAKSCGCYRNLAAIKATKTHGMSKGSIHHHPLYDVWSSMIQRCYNKNNKGYSNYGGRGISVCDEWRTDFQSFYDWSMSNGYMKGLSLDHIDNDKSYSPDNCRWATQHTQSRNKRTNLRVMYLGKEMTLQDIANETHIPRSTLYYRHIHEKPLVTACAN